MEDQVFHERLRLAVKESGYTVQELSMMSGVNKRTIDRWLGKNPPIPNVLEFSYLTKALGYSVNYFIFGTDPKLIPESEALNYSRAMRWRETLADLEAMPPAMAEGFCAAIRVAAREYDRTYRDTRTG